MNDAGKQVLTLPQFQPHIDRPRWALTTGLEHQAQTIGDRPILSWQDDGETLSFAAVNVRVNRLAHGLAAHGVAKGDMVAILLPNCLDYVFSWFALSKLGAIEVAISDAYKGPFLAHPFRLSRARVLIVAPALIAREIGRASCGERGCKSV